MSWRLSAVRWVVAAVVLCTGLVGTTRVAFAYTPEEERLFALNLYHEARSGGRQGMVAIGWVVLNRVKSKQFPNSIEGVIMQSGPGKGCQWGWTCDQKPDEPTEAKHWAEAQEVAQQLLGPDPGRDPTKGALWMHESWRHPPAFTRKLHRTVQIGKNVFYAP